MALTPVEIRHLSFPRRLFGYRRGSVERTLEEVADSFEDVWRDRADLADKVEQLEAEIVRFRELESLLRTTLISAEKASHELKDQAKREADLILSEAHAEARSIAREAAAERERLQGEVRKLRTMLHGALGTLEAAEAEEVVGGEDPPRDRWQAVARG